MSGDLEALIERLATMEPEERAKIEADALDATKGQQWVPNPGPQTDAYYSEADELFYGGQAGGGKSDLVVGLSLTGHKRSLILRRFQDDADELADRMMTIIGNRNGWNGQDHRLRRSSGWQASFKGCKEESDKQRYKGRAHDFYAFDEIGDFLESQYRFIIGWNRSTEPGQRCRVVCTGNPPTSAEGLWVISYWGPWLDPNHPNPAEPGELRWFTTINGVDTEVPDNSPIQDPDHPEKMIIPKSRTFIPSSLDDNPDLAATNYDSVLAGLDEKDRLAYREGRFDVGLQDKEQQMIPTQWVRAAMDRWKAHPFPPRGIPMSTISADVAQGGHDKTCVGWRHDWWFSKLNVIPGEQTPDGPSVAGRILSLRRHDADIVIDMGGGYGGSTYDHLKTNDIRPHAHKGASKSHKKTNDKKLKFVNKRTEIYWKLREALDPSQYQGSQLALPPDQFLLAELTTPTYEETRLGIKMMPKKEVVKLLGRSGHTVSAISEPPG